MKALFVKTLFFILNFSNHSGGSADIRCPYDAGYETYSKYLCRGACSYGYKDKPVETEEGKSGAVRGRFSLHDNTASRIFTVSITGLTAKDAGKYWCGIKTGFWVKDIYIEVNLGITPPVITTPLTSGITSPVTTTPLTSGVLAGIIAGLGVAMLMGAGLLLFCLRKRHHLNARASSPHQPNPEKVNSALEPLHLTTTATLTIPPGSDPSSFTCTHKQPSSESDPQYGFRRHSLVPLQPEGVYQTMSAVPPQPGVYQTMSSAVPLQPEGVYQTMSTVPLQPEGLYQTMSTVPSQPEGLYQTMSTVPSQLEGDYQSMSAVPLQPEGVYQTMSIVTSQPEGVYQTMSAVPMRKTKAVESASVRKAKAVETASMRSDYITMGPTLPRQTRHK
ncbi:CMRF35-like molecule 1 [Engraulis encrasicolus]|uniref:CMRF35-like molecule 1 n=1 Tax=Engraulis encrasicolus TaxID=184585 RepID=UPI002FD66E93